LMLFREFRRLIPETTLKKIISALTIFEGLYGYCQA
jgi:hypothetical protein